MTSEGAGALSVAEWPDHLPPCCPPADAVDLSGSVYYLVSSDPPSVTDFHSAAEKGKFRNADECQRASLSCGVDIEYITQLRDNTPLLGEHLISSAALSAVHGKIKQTGKNPGHHSVWLRLTALQQGTVLFQVVT